MRRDLLDRSPMKPIKGILRPTMANRRSSSEPEQASQQEAPNVRPDGINQMEDTGRRWPAQQLARDYQNTYVMDHGESRQGQVQRSAEEEEEVPTTEVQQQEAEPFFSHQQRGLNTVEVPLPFGTDTVMANLDQNLASDAGNQEGSWLSQHLSTRDLLDGSFRDRQTEPGLFNRQETENNPFTPRDPANDTPSPPLTSPFSDTAFATPSTRRRTVHFASQDEIQEFEVPDEEVEVPEGRTLRSRIRQDPDEATPARRRSSRRRSSITLSIHKAISAILKLTAKRSQPDPQTQSDEEEETDEEAVRTKASRKRKATATLSKPSKKAKNDDSDDDSAASEEGEDYSNDPDVLPLDDRWVRGKPMNQPLKFPVPVNRHGGCKVMQYIHTVDFQNTSSVRAANQYRSATQRRARSRLGRGIVQARTGFTPGETRWIAEQYRATPKMRMTDLVAAFNSHFGSTRSASSLVNHCLRSNDIRAAKGQQLVGVDKKPAKKDKSKGNAVADDEEEDEENEQGKPVTSTPTIANRVRGRLAGHFTGAMVAQGGGGDQGYTSAQDRWMLEEITRHPMISTDALLQRFSRQFPEEVPTAASMTNHLNRTPSLAAIWSSRTRTRRSSRNYFDDEDDDDDEE